ncbi:MAG: hypothetical protein ACRDTK_00565 [Mycobacterium sp.]
MNGDFNSDPTKCPVTRGAAQSDGQRSIYVASSWRNQLQPRVVESLRSLGHWVYDFKRPSSTAQRGFNPTDLDPEHSNPVDGDPWTIGSVSATDYVVALSHPAAVEGFVRDFDAMLAADTFVLVLPCGRSAHLELGWAVGAGRRTAILLDNPCTPELMYRMVDKVATGLDDLVQWLATRPGDISGQQRPSDILNQEPISERLTRVLGKEATSAAPPPDVDPPKCVGGPGHSANDATETARKWLAELERAAPDFDEAGCGEPTVAVEAQLSRGS